MLRQGLSYQFTHAVVRKPAHSVVDGLRATDRGSPAFVKFESEHGVYVKALRHAGLKVTVLEAQEDYPDSVFIEDAALCLPEGVVLLRPGTPSRSGEPIELASELDRLGLVI